jgi:hypothetical protein
MGSLADRLADLLIYVTCSFTSLDYAVTASLRDLQAQLAALQPAFRMDPVERALRMGGVREEAKKLEEDGGTIAGVCGDSALGCAWLSFG